MRVFALLFAIVAAGLAPDRIAGHYVLQGVHEVGSELLLEPDGQFEYMLAYGAADYFATGKWRLKDDTVILDSKVTDAPPFRLLSSAAKRSPVVRVWIKGKNGSPVPNLDVVLKTPSGDTTARTDQDRAAIFLTGRSPKSVMIQVRVYNLNAGPYPLNPAHNDFGFEINGGRSRQCRSG